MIDFTLLTEQPMLLAQAWLLLADGWGWVVPVVFVIIWAINQVLALAKAGQQKQQPQRPGQPPRKRPQAGERPLRPGEAPPKPASPQTQLNAEIEQFLKRANQRKTEKPRRELPSTPARPSEPALRPMAEQALRPMAEQAVDAQPIERRDFDSVAASVEQHLGNRGFAQREAHLADDVVRSEGQLEQHLQQAFSRRVGTLGEADAAPPDRERATDVAGTTSSQVSAAAISLATLLANPQRLREAVMLSVILERPVDRW